MMEEGKQHLLHIIRLLFAVLMPGFHQNKAEKYSAVITYVIR